MAYYRDLTGYDYFPEGFRPGTLNIGWLSAEYEFRQAEPAPEFLERLWRFCTVSVMQSGGVDMCELCEVPKQDVSHSDKVLLLGSAEIRVFSLGAEIYAAPTLIYHYVSLHRYSPPDKFVQAVLEGPSPPDRDYLEKLKQLELDWDWTMGLNMVRPMKLTPKGFVHTDEWA